MNVPERIAKLRSLMEEKGIDIYVVPTADFHQSEYVGEHFKARKFITGFSGSAGTAIITKTGAYLWTDGRYFIQAAKQLEGSTVELMKMGEPGVPTIHEFLVDTLPENGVLGFDGRVVSMGEGQDYASIAAQKNGKVIYEYDLIDQIWEDRPVLSEEPVFALNLKYTGETVASKLSRIREEMKKAGATAHVLTTLDDICWTLNIRGNDIEFFPLVLSYAVITMDKVDLYINEAKLNSEIKADLEKDGVVLKPYNDIYQYVKTIPESRTVLLSRKNANSRLVSSLPDSVKILDEENLTLLPKAIKNPVEVENERIAHIKDGVAVTKFIYWLKKNVGKTTITELSAADHLFALRKEQENFLDNSFDPIVSYAGHAAICHYSPSSETDIPLEPHGLALCDTGGHYLEGSTDITRTVVLGPVTEKEKKYFTLVLKGHLNLAAAKFRYGCTDLNLDYIAREPLWQLGEDYNHGTGHGVGYLLNVHEGPNRFRWKTAPGQSACVLEEGMITSNEPGYYVENEFGIRHENLIVCKKAEKTAYGQFMCFENLTMVPFDLDGIVPELLSDYEKELLNQYHAEVYTKISPYLNEEEKQWLKEATREI